MNINFDLHSQRKGGFKFMCYQPHIRCNIAYTPWPSAYCPPHVPLFTSATLHLLSALLSHFQPNTDTGHLVLFQDCGSILLAVGWLDYIVRTHMCPNLLIIFAREPQWAIWWSNQDLHLTCKGYAYSFTGTALTPYMAVLRSTNRISSLSWPVNAYSIRCFHIKLYTLSITLSYFRLNTGAGSICYLPLLVETG